MIRCYQLKQQANQSKIVKIKNVLKEYRALACKIATRQWYLFFNKGSFNKNTNIKHIITNLSERYKQTCQYQVVGMLDSFISNRKNDFVVSVCHSSLDERTKLDLLFINKYGLWFKDSVQIPVFDDKGKKIKGQYRDIEHSTIKLARKIFKHILSKNCKPSMKHINMALDQKVAVITGKEKTGAKSFDYWIRLSTLDKGKPIYIPVKSNAYFEDIPGDLKNFSQFNLTDAGEVTVSFIKDKPKSKNYITLTPKIALDLGLKNIFTTDRGDIFGRKFYETLLKYDKIITELARNRQKQGLRPKSPRYARLVQKLRHYLKNEINRILNHIVKLYAPKELVVEKLNFQNPNLSKRLNRILSRFGKGVIASKLEAIKEEYGIKVTYINPAYTSQTCHSCGYIDKHNRKTQSEFECKFCGSKTHADVNGARNIKARSSSEMGSVYKSKKLILQALTEQFVSGLERTSRPYSRAQDLILRNPYFKDYWDKFKEIS